MSVPSLGGVSPREREAVVYVLHEHIAGRPFNAEPLKNAAARDLDEIYAADGLTAYPVIRDRYESRALAEGERKRTNRRWADATVDAIYAGAPVPGRMRLRAEQVLHALVAAGPMGQTRKEICTLYRIDGGRVSAAMTLLHECGAIVSLVGVKR